MTFKPGDRVVIDENVPLDDIPTHRDGDDVANIVRFRGKAGVVIRVYDGKRNVIGCGESTGDCGYLVAVHGVGRELFWREELRCP